jgi:hypothetical protein
MQDTRSTRHQTERRLSLTDVNEIRKADLLQKTLYGTRRASFVQWWLADGLVCLYFYRGTAFFFLFPTKK